MNTLEQAKQIVAERLIISQQRQIKGLKLQSEITEQKLAISTIAKNPSFQITAITALYLGVCFIMDYFIKKDTKNA